MSFQFIFMLFSTVICETLILYYSRNTILGLFFQVLFFKCY